MTAPHRTRNARSAEARLQRYLLRQLDRVERASIEQEYFENDEQFGVLLAVEDDLIDAYTRGELLPEDRERFERVYLSTPEGQHRVRVARALNGAVAHIAGGQAAGSAPAAMAAARARRFGTIKFGWIAAAAAVFVGSAGAWAVFEVVTLRTTLSEFVTARETLQRELEGARQDALRERARADTYQETLRRLRQPESGRPSGSASVMTLSLVPVTVRNVGAPDELVLPGGTGIVVLELAVDFQQRPESVRVVVETADRPITDIDIFTGLADLPRVIVVPVPASSFTPGLTYTARVETPALQANPTTLHTYEFRTVAP